MRATGTTIWVGLCVVAGLCLVAPATMPAEDRPVQASVHRDGASVVVDAVIQAPVPVRIAWEVMADFEHMTEFVPNLKRSEVPQRDGNTLRVRQEGVARFGVFSFSFQSEREITFDPPHRIRARNIVGNVKRMESLATLTEEPGGTQIRYHAEVVPDFWLPPVLGPAFMKHEVEEQFGAFVKEMVRRKGLAERGAR